MTHATASTFRRRLKFIALSVVLFAIGLAVVSFILGGEGVIRHLAQLSAGVLVGMLVLSLVNYTTRAFRWHFQARTMGVPAPLRETLLFYFAGFALTTTPGKFGEALRLWFFRESYNVEYTRLAPLFVADRVSDLYAMILICILGIYSFSQYLLSVLVLVAGIVVATYLMLKPALALKTINYAYAKTGKRWRKGAASLRRFVKLNAKLFSLDVLLYSVALSLAGWLAECSAFYWIVTVMNIDITWVHASFIFAFSMVAGAVSMLPGGLGGVEAAMVALLLGAGADIDAAIAATAVIRLTTLWFAVGLGLITLPIGFRTVNRTAQRNMAASQG